VHEYADDAFNLTWFSDPAFPGNLRGLWNQHFGFIVQQDIAPVFIGEFGTSFKYPTDSLWFSMWLNYMNGQFTRDGVNDLRVGRTGLSWAFWSVSPGEDCTPGHVGGDCIKAHFGGILETDWLAVNHFKMSYLNTAMSQKVLSSGTATPSKAPTKSRRRTLHH